MDLDDLHPADDYSHRFFIWHEWIQANGPLTTETVFDYFATSMFYDKQSNNQVLRMQTMHTGQPILNEAEELKRFTGIEFALVHAQPPSLFIIHKRERLSPEEVRPLAAYFIINNRIYQSPDLYTVISNRLLTSLHAVQSSLDVLRTNRPDFTPRTGFIWPIVDAPATDSVTKKRGTEDTRETANESSDSFRAATNQEDLKQQKSGVVTSGGTHVKKLENIIPLLNAMRTTAAHTTASFAAREASEANAASVSMHETPRASSTPGPTQSTREETPISSLAGRFFQQPPPDTAGSTLSRPSTAGGKKKKKRMSSAATDAVPSG
ncbi:MED6-domain-containing protein [Fomitiporia mediterranea MF3/22]|uniref:MED6-domain-containing protein n=1 Tax=Fomitiporia mediterranea (strain MF3/22) TaxID=694068 RepID=UPI0004408971|nr:MED6-domain-containing protein [Fomitiporia mediterranea MF3/22]EJD04339.1 MED6-domain-containing protein [Fomitiporia mediterranea MF3/22]